MRHLAVIKNAIAELNYMGWFVRLWDFEITKTMVGFPTLYSKLSK